MLWLVASVISAVLVYWLHWRWTHRRMLALASKVPGPFSWPIIGNSLVFLKNTDEQLTKISEITSKYGDYIRFWLGPELNICVKNPADIRLLLTSNKVNEKGPVYRFMENFIGPGILTGGKTWRNHRKIATPSYSKKAVQHFLQIFNEEAECLAEEFSKKDPSVAIDVYEDLVKATTQSVCQTLMGLTKQESRNLHRLDEIVAKTPCMYKLIFNKMTRWWLQIPPIYWLTGRMKEERYLTKIIDEFTSHIIRLKKESLEKLGVINEDFMGIVDRYMLSGELNEQELKFEIFSLFTTSQEASAKIASGLIYILANLPDWQDKVYDEIIQVLGPVDGPVSPDQLKQLVYLDMAYKETLRYWSIAAMIQRTVQEEVTICDGKITLPVGTSLVIPIHDLHRDPRYWKHPNRLDPGRFSQENIKKRDVNAFVPFSLGPMDCLGYIFSSNFVLMNMPGLDHNSPDGRVYATSLIKTLVIRLLRRLKFEGVGRIDDLKLDVAISVRSADGYMVRVKRRYCDC